MKKNDLGFTKKPSDLRNNEIDPYGFDRRKEDSKNIKERNEEYTKILIEYRDYFTKSLSFKTRCKKVSVFIFFRCFDSCGTCALYFNRSHGK
jgi:hypothetical protein